MHKQVQQAGFFGDLEAISCLWLFEQAQRLQRHWLAVQAKEADSSALTGGGVQQLLLTVLSLRLDPVACLLASDLEASGVTHVFDLQVL